MLLWFAICFKGISYYILYKSHFLYILLYALLPMKSFANPCMSHAAMPMDLLVSCCQPYSLLNTFIEFIVSRYLHWQEVPFHWQCFNPRAYSYWYLPQCQDGANYNCSKELSSLCKEVSEVSFSQFRKYLHAMLSILYAKCWICDVKISQVWEEAL